MGVRAEEAYLWQIQGLMEWYNGWRVGQGSLGRSLALYREIGDRCRASDSLTYLSWASALTGDFAAAKHHAGESTAIRRDLGHASIGDSHALCGGFGAIEGRLEECEQAARRELAAGRELGLPDVVSDWLMRLSQVAELACTLPAVANSIWIQGVVRGPIAHGAGALAPDVIASARERGLARDVQATMTELIALWVDPEAQQGVEARRLCLESIADLQACGTCEKVVRNLRAGIRGDEGPDEIEQARQSIVQALQRAIGRGHPISCPWGLPAVAMLLLQQGEVERAVEMYELARTIPPMADSQWAFDVIGQPIRQAAGALPVDVVTAARERGRARDVQTTLAELIEEWSC